MRNEVIYDKSGRPDIMVAFTPDELGLPATLKGRKVAEYLISKYPNTLINGVPYSLPYQQPAVNVTLDEAIRLCEDKGPGWHLFTNDEWVALAHWSRKNGTLPRGNTNNGKSHSHPEETGTTYPNSYGKTLTGSGPVTWNHDHTAEGVADMCGNVWEHVGGIRFLDGQTQVIPNNEAAAGADQSKDSKEWQAIYTPDGDPIYFNPVDGDIFVQPHEATDKDYDGVAFTDLHASELDVPDKLIELGLYPAPGYDGTDFFWVDNSGERCVFRGGNWNNGSGAGVFSLSGLDSRPSSSTGIGFRSALVRYSGDSGKSENLDNEQQNKAPEREAIVPEKTLPGLVRLVLAHQLAVLYKAAGGPDPDDFTRMAYEANDKELQQAAALAMTLAQVNAGVDMYRTISKQIELASTLTITIGKEAADHE